MTVLAAIVDRADRTVIGSDTRVTAGNMVSTCKTKWVTHAGWSVGCSGHLRTINVVAASADELLHDLRDPYHFTLRLMHVLERASYRHDRPRDGEDGSPPSLGQPLLLARPGKLWSIGSDLSILEARTGEPVAEGSGYQYALGAAYALDGKKMTATELVVAMLSAAARFDPYCGGKLWTGFAGED